MNKKIIVGIIVVLIIVVSAFFYYRRMTDELDYKPDVRISYMPPQENANMENKEYSIPKIIKNLPVSITPYDEKTNQTGDIKFSKMNFSFDRLYFEYGFTIPKSIDFPARENPQPTFIAPLGTKVRAIADGVVVNIPKLYSGDYSIMLAESANVQYAFEMEHVINPTVKVGDTVKAGDIVGEVSDYDAHNTPGYGLVEIGVLKGGNPPEHHCPFLYLDPGAKKEILDSLEDFMTNWNAYKGKTIYNTAEFETPGCLKTAAIEG